MRSQAKAWGKPGVSQFATTMPRSLVIMDLNHAFESIYSSKNHLMNQRAYEITRDRAGSCPPGEQYEDVINWVARHIYEPKTLGNLDALKNNTTCTTDFVAKANQALRITGDKYNHLLSKEEVEQFKISHSGHFVGIGLVVDKAYPEVIKRVEPNSPAEAAGFKKGDIISKIDKTDTRNMTVDALGAILRGPEGTAVDVTVKRNGQLIAKEVTRKVVDVPSVDAVKDLGNGITYISITDFNNDKTTDELAAAVKKFADTKAFIIDVRNNPGGILEQSVASSELFIKQGKIVTIRQRQDSDPAVPLYSDIEFGITEKDAYIKTSNHELNGTLAVQTVSTARQPDIVGNRPVIVLTDGGSASSAEIFIGALHDTAKAVTIGERTYGKGIGQAVNLDGPDGTGIKVTYAHDFTPSGQWAGDAGKNRIGFLPDIRITNPIDAHIGSARDLQFQTAVSYLKKRLPH